MQELCNKYNAKLLIPRLLYCTDNAAMIASAGRIMFEKKLYSSLDLSVKPSYDLEKEGV
jgi:N6-L-threonylcarbamoyladenine synthase